MRSNIHPNYREVTATCSCGNVFTLWSVSTQNLRLDVCNHCHPFYTGKQRIADAKGQVERFNKRFGHLNKGSAEA